MVIRKIRSARFSPMSAQASVCSLLMRTDSAGGNGAFDNAVPGFIGLVGVRYFVTEHFALFGNISTTAPSSTSITSPRPAGSAEIIRSIMWSEASLCISNSAKKEKAAQTRRLLMGGGV